MKPKPKPISLWDVFRSFYFSTIPLALVMLVYALTGPVDHGFFRLFSMMGCGIIIGLRIHSSLSHRITMKIEAQKQKELTASIDKEFETTQESLRELFKLRAELISKINEANKILGHITVFCERVSIIKSDARATYDSSYVSDELSKAMIKLAKDTGMKVDFPDLPEDSH